jgi:tetratricopeptide (TPR) repeat protein
VLPLDWDRRGRVTPAGTKSQEAWPGAEPGCESPGESRGEAPEGERAPDWRAAAPGHQQAATFVGAARLVGMRLSALRLPLLWIADNPANAHAYFDRHFAWMELGEPQRALDDLNVVIQLNPQPVAFWSRGEVYRLMGEYEKALEDFDRAEQIDPAQWTEDAFGLLVQADCHARLGNEAAALACCARLHDDFWTPGIEGAPGGGKAEIAETLRRMAADARRGRG